MVSERLLPLLPHFAHHFKMAGHPGWTRMFAHILRTYYWPLMVADIACTVFSCPNCGIKRLNLIRWMQQSRFFHANQPLKSVAVDLFGLFPKTKAVNRFIPTMATRFINITPKRSHHTGSSSTERRKKSCRIRGRSSPLCSTKNPDISSELQTPSPQRIHHRRTPKLRA